MAISHSFAGLPVSDYETAYEWYVVILGRTADMFPHDREAVWRLTPTASIYVVEDDKRAGSGLVTLALDDLEAHETRLKETGIAVAEKVSGDAPRQLVVTDRDGNTLSFFQDPASLDV